VDSSIFESDPGLSPESNPSEGDAKREKPKTVYRCKKCQRVVAVPENVVSHTAGEGESCFEWQKRKSGNPYNRFGEVECTSMFVEPLKWMTSGKISSLVLPQHTLSDLFCLLFTIASHHSWLCMNLDVHAYLHISTCISPLSSSLLNKSIANWSCSRLYDS